MGLHIFTLVEGASFGQLYVEPTRLGLQIFNHFEWHYNAAIAQAAATTVVPSWSDFDDMESQLQKATRAIVSGTMSTLSTTVLSFIAFLGVHAGRAVLGFTLTSNSRSLGRLYRLFINLFFFYFTIPIYVITHLAYYMGL